MLEQMQSEAMLDRYGVGKGWASKGVLVTMLTMLAIIVIAILALALPGLFKNDVALINNGHKVLSDSEISLTFSLYGEKGQTVTCQAEAVNKVFAQIGAREFEITLEADKEAHELILATSERASSGQIATCTTNR